MGFYIYLPTVQEMVVWDGANFAECRTLLDPATDLVDNGDGTLTMYGVFTVNIGDGVINGGVHINRGPFIAESMEQVGSAVPPRFAFATELSNLYVPVRRRKDVAVPGLLLLQKTTLAVTWDTPMPSAVYDVSITPKGAGTLVGAVTWSLVSQTAAGCVVAVQAALAISVGTLTLAVSATS